MLNLIKKLYNDSRIRYLFFGGLTTLVNLGNVCFIKKDHVELIIRSATFSLLRSRSVLHLL